MLKSSLIPSDNPYIIVNVSLSQFLKSLSNSALLKVKSFKYLILLEVKFLRQTSKGERETKGKRETRNR